MKFAIVLACLLATAVASPRNWRVVEGKDAADGQFPYQVSLRYRGAHSCGGSIAVVLDATTILSAAHCIDIMDPGQFNVTVGHNKLSDQTEVYPVSKLIMHEKYLTDSEHDISIIKLSTPISFHAGVAPVKLPTRNIGAETVVLSGWGLLSNPGDRPDHLQFVKLKTITLKECRKKLGDIPDYQVCTHNKFGGGSCEGDSGGPLVDTRGEQVGIVSYGDCGWGYPDVFTRVYSYLDWIETHRN